MKNMNIKAPIFFSILFLMMLISLVFTNGSVYASSLQVVGSDNGLEIIPHDSNLYSELNLGPGDYKEANLTVSNTYNTSFELMLQVSRLDEEPPVGSPDLFKQLMLSVTFKGEEIYNGSMIDFATDPNGIQFGTFEPDQSEDIQILVHLPGKDTGNEFMGISHNNQWKFTAISDEELVEIPDEEVPIGGAIIPDINKPDKEILDEEVPLGGAKLPKTGSMALTSLFSIIGIALVGTGAVGAYKSRNKK
ncbi:LPXTG cell wall anchor domain-containing protein [Alkalibaculum sporogenes]|nr:LPXTG cell wall anchor domain-containing protein [Alkalibaculum sporogenes]